MYFNKEKLDKFLVESSEIYKKIPIKEKTFMDISGYPHYENVCSNILAFYFNPNEEHGMGNIVITALINAIKKQNINVENVDTSYFEIEREYITLKGNRIDIIIKNEDIVIGIENKIYASLYNDLKDYSETIDKINKSHSLKVVLSMYDNKEKVNNTDFINITYFDFFNELKPLLENIKDKNNKWYIFLLEFIKNLKDYKGDNEMEEEIINWMSQHHNEIADFYEIKKSVNDIINKKVKDLKQLLEDKIDINYIKIWDSDLEKGCYIDSPKKYHVDATLTYMGWKVGIFTWTKSTSDNLIQTINNSNYNLLEDDGNHRWLLKYEFNENIDVLVDKIIELYNYFENRV